MKGMRGKWLKKLKLVRPIVNASDGYVFGSWRKTSLFQQRNNLNKTPQEPEESDLGDVYDDKENLNPRPQVKPKHSSTETEDEQSGIEDAEIDISSFRRPDLNSRTLFDPKLLAAFRQAINQHIEEPPLKARRIQNHNQIDPLLSFKEKCPPGGEGAVILYTTSLTGIRKTFENCNSIRFLLETFRVVYIERDISMHRDFKEELRRVLGGESGVPPKLFIKGRYIGGAEEVLRLHEQGKLQPLFQGLPIDRSIGSCEGCTGVRFVICFNCSGSRRTVSDHGSRSTCTECNENGLQICPFCC